LRGITFAAIILIDIFFEMIRKANMTSKDVHQDREDDILRTRIQDWKSAGTLSESALGGAVTRCKSVDYPPP